MLAQTQIAYVTYGTLNADGNNAVLVTHGLTSGHNMLVPSTTAGEGSWGDLLRTGGALDSTKYFVVCSNVIGSSFGSTGPASLRAGLCVHWGPDFPQLTISDMVRAQKRLLEQLGVQRLRCVLGPSYGGMQALQWALDWPEEVESIAAVVSGLHWPEGLSSQQLTQRYLLDQEWNDGHYRPGLDMLRTMAPLRYETLVDYGMEQVLQHRHPPMDRHAIERFLRLQAQSWSKQFDPISLWRLQQAGERFDVRQRLPSLQCPALFVIANSDKLFPPDATTQALLKQAGNHVHYQELDTPFGHTSSGLELAQWEPQLRQLLEKTQLPNPQTVAPL